MATIAVFLALGGGTYAAAHLGKNSVGTKQIRNGAVREQKIANGAVSGSKLAPDSVTGANINESTLVYTCPSGYSRAGKDVCYDGGHAAANYGQSLANCALQGDRLPTVPEGLLILGALPNNTQTWAADETSTTTAEVLIKDSGGNINRAGGASQSGTSAFRCVTSGVAG